MNKFGILLWCAVAAVLSAGAKPLPRATPEAVGVSSAEVLKYVEALDTQIEGIHSVMIVRRGSVIAEGWWAPYRAENRHTMYSLSKSFAATGIGIAQAEGKLSVDDTVMSFFPDLAPTNASSNLKAMRVRDLLAMSTGQHNEDLARFDYVAEDAVKQFLALPVAHKPGTHFVYNTPASFMLSAIVHKVTGQSLLEYLGPRLLAPLGIEDARWDAGKTGISLGGFGLHIRTEDIAKFGQLYLQEGQWEGKALLQKEWVHAASARQTSNGSNPKSDWDQGYGYQFWRCRNGAYRGDGAFGQFCVVMPAEQTVVAITSGVRDMQKVLDVTWTHLLPALKSGGADPSAQPSLKTKLATLKLPAASGTEEPPRELGGKSFKFAENQQRVESVSFEIKGGDTILNIQSAGKTHRLECAPGKWRDGQFAWAGISPLEGARQEPVAVSGGWNANVFTAKIAFVETPYVLTLTCKATNEQVTIDPELNVAFGSTKRPQLIGQAENR